ncbi:hypothetical protein ERHA54_01510 [Erwinia rhapontici]|uniref:Uncharacterized protein n=1 Tax=Erwinia rhapontici TaxID=55212 RepID=A0ABN6DDF3_ERWRD|nr:hypothetical protein [Erwinia rhapontici]BCQ32788.1 hypothetical protein ERHA53_01310 [Erwinia rhapontici]BCQ37548.1 hypothetical protein ERHA54_01510 [Erwinia rhapontici]BCQ42624.1 hypothetical protein ERHA55_01510 [Erwinia rhapontici]
MPIKSFRFTHGSGKVIPWCTVKNNVNHNKYILDTKGESFSLGLDEILIGSSIFIIPYKKNLTRTNLLTQCMLQERLEKRDEGCYKKVIALSEENNAIDSDYISALFFMDDKRFEALRHELIKENKFKESDFLVFTLGKEKMLHEFFP